jgi:hypothetical protein
MINNMLLSNTQKHSPRRKVFVSYHHAQDQKYANEFRTFYGWNDTFLDRSLPDEIDSYDNDYIMSQIRQKHLKESTVTVVLIGRNTWSRKWVDWEIFSSLRPYSGRTVNGLLGILLPEYTKLPPRLEANYNVKNGYQVGYAILLNWADIAPPPMWRLMPNSSLMKLSIERKKSKLTEYIEHAYNNRTKTYLINNTEQRFKNNKPIFPIPLFKQS